MLILPEAGLVVLEMPKAASMSLRRALGTHAVASGALGLPPRLPRHLGVGDYQRCLAGLLAARLGQAPQTLCLVREPLRRMQSWYCYLSRDAGRRGLRWPGFDAFLRGYLADGATGLAWIGRQDRFAAWDGQAAQVDHVFDLRFPDAVTDWIGRRVGCPLNLPHRNCAPRLGPQGPLDLVASDAVPADDHVRHADEFAFFGAGRRAGHLVRRRQAMAA
ncbi:MAG: hypothetical protein ACK4L4_07360 [Gemmobacter sp.]